MAEGITIGDIAVDDLVSTYRIAVDTGTARHSGECLPTVTLLEAMRAIELPVRKACRNGVCGLCRCRLAAGEITYHWKEPHGLWQKDIQQGYILPCIAYPLSDLALDNPSLLDIC